MKTIYKCDFCGHESEIEKVIDNCELSHQNCKHETYDYDVFVDDNLFLLRTCRKCYQRDKAWVIDCGSWTPYPIP